MPNRVLVETGVLVLIRAALVFACRNLLLRSLYSDLQSLSKNSTIISRKNETRTEEDIELEALPLPSTHTPKSPSFPVDASFIHASLSRIIFSFTFAESCMMFFMLMMQGMDLLSARTRLLNWKFSLFLLMTTILVIVPASISLLSALGSLETRATRKLFGLRFILSLIPVAFYLYSFSFIPLPAEIARADIPTATLSRLIVLGTIILGLLSGFGAVSNSWPFIPFFSRIQTQPSEQDINAAEYTLASVRNDLRERMEEASRRAESQGEGSWLSRVSANLRGGDDLSQQRQGLESLEYQMTRNIESLRQRRDAAIFAATFRGKLYGMVGRLFAIYCITRFFNSLYNIIFLSSRRSSNTNYSDLLTDLLVYGLSRTSSSSINLEDVASFSRQISLVLVGLIILTSIRVVLHGVTRALRITSRNAGASLMLLFLAQLMGVYLLSTIVQIRSSFPPPPTRPGQDPAATNLFSTIPEYEVFGSLFDWAFLLSAAASVFVRWGAEKVNGVDDD